MSYVFSFMMLLGQGLSAIAFAVNRGSFSVESVLIAENFGFTVSV
jgi:hypothetical protein